MSFSSDVKSELARQCSKSRHCQLAELAGMLELEGVLEPMLTEETKRPDHTLEGGQAEEKIPMILKLSSDNELLTDKFRTLIQKAFGFDTMEGLSEEQSAEVLRTLRWNSAEEGSEPLEMQRADGLLVQRTCCKRAFIRGAFMAAGSISDPNKSYHFEIVCSDEQKAEQLRELIRSFEIDAKIVMRKKSYVVYVKEGAQIVDMLAVMEANVALMNLENIRIVKEMRNTVNRKVNCETANINKTVNAAVKQTEDIRLIQEKMGFHNLNEGLAEIAELRLQYPEATLKELGMMLNPQVGKSGVNHRLRKLSEIADGLRMNEEDLL